MNPSHLLFTFAGIALTFPAVAHGQDVPIVYVRCQRTTASQDVSMDVVVDGVTRRATRTLTGFDVEDQLPEVTHFLGDFNAPCDLMHRDAAGNERVLYDCSSTSTDAASCAATDPAVSFDGATVAFSVFRGPLARLRGSLVPRVVEPRAEPGSHIFVTFPNRRIRPTEAQLHLVDVATGAVRPLPHVAGTFDSGPAFLPNGRLAFTSTRDEHRTTVIARGSTYEVGTRTYAMDLDGRNIDVSSHHMNAQDQHPFVLRDGRVALSTWQIFGAQNLRHEGFVTLGNLFHIYTQHPDGAEQFAFFGQHAGTRFPIGSTGAGHDAAHFLTQTSDGRVWFADYYRANNLGLGVVIGMISEPTGQEGFGPHEIEQIGDLYAPRNAISLARWATNRDRSSLLMSPAFSVPHYRDPLPFAGKLGHPAALPMNGLMVAWGKGPCATNSDDEIFAALGRETPPATNGAGGGVPENVITSLGLDIPGCDVGIYRVTTIPSMHPRDLQVIVDSPDWHEFQARALVPYAAIHGVERPEVIQPADLRTSHHALEVGTPFGLLGAASILDRETHPYGGIHFQGPAQFHTQGSDTIEYSDDALCGVRILGLMPNRGSSAHTQIASVAGERVRILGELAVRHNHADGTPRLDPSGHPDTSFLVRFPANIPYLMQGIDCDGRTLNTDQVWQSLRPGEQKTCGGCHVHSRSSRITFEQSFAATDAYTIPHFGEGVVPLLAGRSSDGTVRTQTASGYGLDINFQADILPIFERRCTSCHGGSAPAAGLALDRAGSGSGSTWSCLVADARQSCVPDALKHDAGPGRGTTLRPPQLTRYMRAFNSLASLLYWKAAGQRTDGRTDATFGEDSPPTDRDIDFGAAHPTDMTAEELGLLSRWIDIGAPGGPMESRDTQRPTLHLAATVTADAVTSLHVGTVDLGSGVDVSSLEVCILDGDVCGTDLSIGAAPHGVVHVSLTTPLRDPSVEVRARILDLAGNETEVRRTVAWLLRAPPPAPPRPDGGVLPDGGPLLADGSVLPDGSATPDGEGGRIGGNCSCGVRGASDDAAGAMLGLVLVLAAIIYRRSPQVGAAARRLRQWP